ncbi:MAG: hypothetical protein AB7Q17_17200 [Phycisphaerae bacterium]
MPDDTFTALLWTAASIGLIHTLAGPDHYVPFIAMSAAGRWSLRKTLVVTLLCGVGHVLGSIALGFIGVGLGTALGAMEWFEGVRGQVAGWLLLGFGIAYTAWGVRRAYLGRTHTHWHVRSDGSLDVHGHPHAGRHSHSVERAHRSGASHRSESRQTGEHSHAAQPVLECGAAVEGRSGRGSECERFNAEPVAAMTPRMVPWVLFTIFVFGPCEPLIPLLMVPAARLDFWAVAAVSGMFAVFTIGTMLTVVLLAALGVAGLGRHRLEHFGHPAAGLALAACGVAVVLGL